MAALLLFRLLRRRARSTARPEGRRAALSGTSRPEVLRRLARTGIPAIVVAAYWRTIAAGHLSVGKHLEGQGFLASAAGIIHLFLILFALAWLAAALGFLHLSERDLGRFLGAALAPGLVPVATGSFASLGAFGFIFWLLALLVTLAVLTLEINGDEIVPPDPNEISPYHHSLLEATNEKGERLYTDEQAARIAEAAAKKAANEIFGEDDVDD